MEAMNMEINELQQNLKNLVDSVSGTDKTDIVQQLIMELKGFLQYIERVDKNAVEEVLQDLESTADNTLFKEVGKLLRRFHDQLVLIREGIPEDLGRIASQEVVEMSERLQMIVTMTDKAANTTLDLTEDIIQTVENQNASLTGIVEELEKTAADETLPEALTNSLKSTIKQIQGLTETNDSMQTKLTDILIAQDYQDLTGQVINKVINLLKSLETDLAKLIDRFGQVMSDTGAMDSERLVGPLSEEDEEKSSQEDVDALLNKFGF